MGEQTQHVEVSTTHVGHNIVHTIMDSGGLWWLLGFAVIGVATIFKGRIKQWLKS